MRKLPIVTARAAVDIRGVYGQSVLDLYEQLRRLLVQNTGSRAAGDVFAEPQLNPVRGEIAWYTGATGLIVPAAQLAPDAQQALWEQLEQLRAQIKCTGERYIAGGGQTAGTRADTFRAMLTVTDPARCLFSVGGQPVLVEWGCSLVEGEERSVDLWTTGATRVQTPSAEPTAEETPAVEPGPPAESQARAAADTPQARPAPAIEPGQPEQKEQPDATRPRKSPAHVVSAVPPAASPARVSIAAHTPRSAPDGRDMHWRGRRSNGTWGMLKYLLLLLMAVLLIGVLARACSAGSASPVLSSGSEEQQLRVEIASLREQAGHIAAHCAPTGTTP